MDDGKRSQGRPSKSDRIRDNQRRSRQRKKEYLHELERKVRQYEADGVKASAEMQAAARQVVEDVNLVRDENQKLRQYLHTFGVTEAQIEERLRLTSRVGSSRRGSTQTTAITSMMAGTSMSMNTDRLERMFAQQSSRIRIPPMQEPQDDDDDSEDEEQSPVQTSASSSKRPSIVIKPALQSRNALPSPARQIDSSLLQSGPHSISSSTASTPSIERQNTSQDYSGTLPDPRVASSRQLASSSQTEMYGVASVPAQTYTYGMHPSQSPWARQADFPPPVSVYPTQPSGYVQADASSPIGMLPPNILSTTLPYPEPAAVPTTHSMGMQPMMPSIGHSGSRQRRNPNVKPDPNLPERWN